MSLDPRFNGILLPVYSLALLFCVTDRRFMGSAPQTRCGNLSLVAAVTVTCSLKMVRNGFAACHNSIYKDIYIIIDV